MTVKCIECKCTIENAHPNRRLCTGCRHRSQQAIWQKQNALRPKRNIGKQKCIVCKEIFYKKRKSECCSEICKREIARLKQKVSNYSKSIRNTEQKLITVKIRLKEIGK